MSNWEILFGTLAKLAMLGSVPLVFAIVISRFVGEE